VRQFQVVKVVVLVKIGIIVMITLLGDGMLGMRLQTQYGMVVLLSATVELGFALGSHQQLHHPHLAQVSYNQLVRALSAAMELGFARHYLGALVWNPNVVALLASMESGIVVQSHLELTVQVETQRLQMWIAWMPRRGSDPDSLVQALECTAVQILVME